MPDWKQEILEHFRGMGFDFSILPSERYDLIHFQGVVLHLISLKNDFNANELIALQEDHKSNGAYLVQLWEDIWTTRKAQVLGRVGSILGLNVRIHARKTKVVTLSQQEADAFLAINHLQLSVKAKYRFGLEESGMLVAVATFSNLRYMKHRAGYRSAELIRFATVLGYTVTGGFSKLLKYFIATYRPDDVMSYADRDWSLGKVYEQAGFELNTITSPLEIKVRSANMSRHFPHRLTDVELLGDEYIPAFNTGNLKYLLYL